MTALLLWDVWLPKASKSCPHICCVAVLAGLPAGLVSAVLRAVGVKVEDLAAETAAAGVSSSSLPSKQQRHVSELLTHEGNGGMILLMSGNTQLMLNSWSALSCYNIMR